MSFSTFYHAFIAKVFATGAVFLTGIVALKLVSKYLAPAQFGLFVVASQVLAYLPLLDGGVRTVANRELLTGSEERRAGLLRFVQKFYTWFGLLLLPLAMLVMAGYGVTPNVARSGESVSFFVVFGVSMVALTFAFAQGSLLVGLHAQTAMHWAIGLSSLVQLGALYAGFRMGLELWAYPAANFVAFFCSWPLLITAIKRKAPELKIFSFVLDAEFWSELRGLRRAALHSFLSQVSILLLFTVDVVIVGLWARPEVAVLYALMVRVLGIVRSFIQTIGEVAWPILAKDPRPGGEIGRVLLNVNAWIYGSVTGALIIFLLPFLRWYMGEEWVASEKLFFLLLARFVIVGLENPAGYFLIALGKFATLAKCLWRELLVALVLALSLLRWDGLGVAAGFLASTAFGTLYHIVAAYAHATGQPPLGLLGAIWWRTLAGCAASFGVGWLLLPLFSGASVILGAGLGVLIGLGVGVCFAVFRSLRCEEKETVSLRQVARFV